MFRKIENFFILGNSLIALLVYSILLFSCFKYTGANPNFKIEFPTLFQDHVIRNVLAVVLALIAFPHFISMFPYAVMGAGIFFSTKWNSFIEKLHVKKLRVLPTI